MGQFLAKLREDQSPEGKQRLQRVFHDHQAHIDMLKMFPPGPDRAKMVHEKLDMLIAGDRAKNPLRELALSCKKGCAYCCRIQVMITPDEGALLVTKANELDLKLDYERMKEQATWEIEDYKKNAASPKVRCVFLNDNEECQVYEDRPSACRSYFVISPPADCDPVVEKNVKVFAMPVAAILESAALNTTSPPVYTTLPRELAKYIK